MNPRLAAVTAAMDDLLRVHPTPSADEFAERALAAADAVSDSLTPQDDATVNAACMKHLHGDSCMKRGVHTTHVTDTGRTWEEFNPTRNPVGHECEWCHCIGYHSEVCEGFEINDPARSQHLSGGPKDG